MEIPMAAAPAAFSCWASAGVMSVETGLCDLVDHLLGFIGCQFMLINAVGILIAVLAF